MVKLAPFLVAFALVALAQSEEPKMVVNLEGPRYPKIASMARISGVVVFEITPSGQQLISESSLILIGAAEKNLATWALPSLGAGRYIISYHFELLAQGVKRESVPIGNGFERFFRRLVGAKTETSVERCYRPEDPQPTFTVAKGDDVKIDVFARAHPWCLQTQVAELALNSHL